MKKEQLEELLATESRQLQKLNEIVIQAVDEKKLLSEKLYEFEEKQPPFSARLADQIAAFGGSWKFKLIIIDNSSFTGPVYYDEPKPQGRKRQAAGSQ